jgi:hypothetical protein
MRYGCYYIMMKKFKGFVISNWKLIVVILLVIIFSVAFWGYIKEMEFRKRVMSLMEIGIFKEEEFLDTIEIESNNIVTNRTDNEYYDNIVEVGLYELGIDCVYVRINDITDQAKSNFDIDTELRAHIIGRGNQYTIWIDEMGQDESIKVLSHELIHLEQYRNREIILEEYYVVWRGVNYTYGDIERMDYLKRPWEIDAINKSKKLRESMEGILYGR